MGSLRREEGTALLTTILVMSIMLVLGFALLSVVDTQTTQTRQERQSESAFNLAEATLNAEAFLLGRNWPYKASSVPDAAAPVAPCSGQTVTGDLTTPAATTTMRDQIQSILAQTARSSGGSTAPTWWVNVCEEGTNSAWSSGVLNGNAYDPTVASSPAPKPRRLWVRAEAHVDGHRRAVAALVQAGQAPVFPTNLAVITGKMSADLTTTTGQVVTGGVVGPLLNTLTGGGTPLISGPIGLRCSLLDNTELLGCLNGLFKLTSITTLAPLLQANDYVDFRSDSTISAERLALLRQQAQADGTYYATTSAGVGTVANGGTCLPAGNAASAGKVIFIEQVGDGTGSCILNTAGSPAPNATAVIVGSGGVKVQGGGTFTGVVYALHRTALAGGIADIRVEGGSHIVGGAFADDNAALPAASRHGMVEVVPPAINMSSVLSAITATLPICQIPILGAITCKLTTLLGGTLDTVLTTLGISASTLAAAMLNNINSSLPAITYNQAVVERASTFGDSSVVTGTFRQVTPSH